MKGSYSNPMVSDWNQPFRLRILKSLTLFGTYPHTYLLALRVRPLWGLPHRLAHAMICLVEPGRLLSFESKKLSTLKLPKPTLLGAMCFPQFSRSSKISKDRYPIRIPPKKKHMPKVSARSQKSRTEIFRPEVSKLPDQEKCIHDNGTHDESFKGWTRYLNEKTAVPRKPETPTDEGTKIYRSTKEFVWFIGFIGNSYGS